jgi:hypothetical protein
MSIPEELLHYFYKLIVIGHFGLNFLKKPLIYQIKEKIDLKKLIPKIFYLYKIENDG